MQDNLIEQIQTASNALPKKQATICKYICEHPLEVSALTASELAEHLGIGTATVTRLINRLGFANYPDFRRALRKSSVFKLKDSYPKYWDARLQLLVTENGEETKLYHTILERVSQCIQRLDTDDFFARLDQSIKMILSARRIGVVGFRSARALALAFTYSLHNSMSNIVPLCEDPEYAYDTIADWSGRDVVILYATLPYAKKTGEIARLCQKQEIPTILITTNSELSHPLAHSSKLVLAAEGGTEFSAYFPQMLITELLTKQINVQLAEISQKRLEQLEQLLSGSGLALWETSDTN